jgi:hypothetical protein
LDGGIETTEKICSVCSRRFSLLDNRSGLVFGDEHFVCQDCCDTRSNDEITRLTKTSMILPTNGMPIGLWLIHEQNKNKTMMTVKK